MLIITTNLSFCLYNALKYSSKLGVNYNKDEPITTVSKTATIRHLNSPLLARFLEEFPVVLLPDLDLL